jgi:hypothetical protein
MYNTAGRDAENSVVPGMKTGRTRAKLFQSCLFRLALGCGYFPARKKQQPGQGWKSPEVDLTPSSSTLVMSHALVTKRREKLRTPVSSWRDAWDGPGRATQRSPHTR